MGKRYLRVTRGPYYRGPYRRNGFIRRHRVAGHVARVPDVGRLGRGPKVIPPLKRGKLTKVAGEMGYHRVADVPESRLEEFVDRLVKTYGARAAFGRIHAMVILRKRAQPEARERFERMREILTSKYGWRKVNGFRTVEKRS